MDAWTLRDASWPTDLGPARSRPAPLTSFADECLTLSAQLDRDFEALHRLGEELLDRIAPPTDTDSARTAYTPRPTLRVRQGSRSPLS
jgi:hypothetical protein